MNPNLSSLIEKTGKRLMDDFSVMLERSDRETEPSDEWAARLEDFVATAQTEAWEGGKAAARDEIRELAEKTKENMSGLEYPKKAHLENEGDYRKRKRGFQIGKSKLIDILCRSFIGRIIKNHE